MPLDLKAFVETRRKSIERQSPEELDKLEWESVLSERHRATIWLEGSDEP